jgi:NAD(P)-dependent dehydrogenase (short-subunit alcohol dehydrogenase family)
MAEALFVKTDVSKQEDVESFINKAVEAFGRIDIMFNNAGIGAGGMIPRSRYGLLQNDWSEPARSCLWNHGSRTEDEGAR